MASLTSPIDLSDLTPHERSTLVPLRPILLGYRGSVAHGMYVPSSEPESVDDVDLMGIYVSGLDFYFGGVGSDVQERFVKHYDVVAYEVRKFVRLLEKGNPNVISLLWIKPERFLVREREGEMLIAARSLFATKKAHAAFGGYAYAQLKRMTAWGAQDRCCLGEQFHTEDCPLREGRGRGSSKKFATGWMGAKRKALVEKFGYDTKNAAHLLRLLRMGIEFLRDGVLRVDRSEVGDAGELLSVKRGEWPLAKVRSEAERLFPLLDEAAALSPLPDESNQEKVTRLIMDVVSTTRASDAVFLKREVDRTSDPHYNV